MVKSKYNSLKEWKKANKSAYTAAARRGLIDAICKEFGWIKKNTWNLKKCLLEAKKFKTRSEWAKKSNSSYQVAAQNSWLSKCAKHMMRPRREMGHWTLERCKKDALKYNSRSEWSIKSGSAYQRAVRNGWLDKCCKHIKKYTHSKI